jgi:hypothetical protein
MIGGSVGKTFGNDFQQDIRINRFKLDEECEIQPALYHYYAEEYAQARSVRDAAKDKLDLVLGEREIHIRRNPPDDMKVTEGVISALLVQDSDVQAAKEAYRVAQAKVDLLYAATTSLDHRKSELDNLVTIWTKDYYSGVAKEDTSVSIRKSLNKGKEV